MIRATGAWGVSILSIALATGAGCATIAGGHGERRDVHASTQIAGVGARVLVTGPALLMHVDVEGRDDLVLYAVARKDGTEADCAAGQTGERRRIRPGVSNLVNLPVAAGQTICIAAAPDSRIASVLWHARRIEGGPVGGRGEALAFDAAGR